MTDDHKVPSATPVERVRDVDITENESHAATEVQIEIEGQKPGPDVTDLLMAEAIKLTREGDKRAAGAVLAEVGGKQAREYLKNLVSDFGGLTPTELKALVKAGFVQKAIKAEDERVQLKALENLAGMPEVGLAPTYAKIGIQINTGVNSETQSVLDALNVATDGPGTTST